MDFSYFSLRAVKCLKDVLKKLDMIPRVVNNRGHLEIPQDLAGSYEVGKPPRHDFNQFFFFSREILRESYQLEGIQQAVSHLKVATNSIRTKEFPKLGRIFKTFELSFRIRAFCEVPRCSHASMESVEPLRS